MKELWIFKYFILSRYFRWRDRTVLSRQQKWRDNIFHIKTLSNVTDFVAPIHVASFTKKQPQDIIASHSHLERASDPRAVASSDREAAAMAQSVANPIRCRGTCAPAFPRFLACSCMGSALWIVIVAQRRWARRRGSLWRWRRWRWRRRGHMRSASGSSAPPSATRTSPSGAWRYGCRAGHRLILNFVSLLSWTSSKHSHKLILR
jgi:hypothetical protein